MPTLDLLTVGDVSVDLYMRIAPENAVSTTDKNGYPEVCFYHGSKIPVDHFETEVAGNALNVSVGVGRLGHSAGIYSILGDDENGSRVANELLNFGVDTSLLVREVGAPTDVHTVIIYGGERTILSYHGKRKYEVGALKKLTTPPKWIYYTSIGHNFENFQTELMGWAKENNVGVAVNPGTMQITLGATKIPNVLSQTDILFVNKEEAQKLTSSQSADLQTLHKLLHALGPKLSVITDSVNGASAFDGTNFISMPAVSDSRPVADKTGAGDAFASGFMSAIIYNKPLKQALTWGLINAGACIKEIGAIKGLLNKTQLEAQQKNQIQNHQNQLKPAPQPTKLPAKKANKK